MRVGIITSNHIRHRFLANSLARDFDVALVLAEEKRRDPARVEGPEEDRRLLSGYFSERSRSEADLLPEGSAWDEDRIARVQPVPPGEINAPSWVSAMRDAGAGLIAVFGSSILKEPWLTAFGGRMVNMHLGLSPYYRGAATNFWALYYEQPELVGATIHLIDPGVDSGAILRHARPRIAPGDTPHSIGNRTIREGVRALARSLREYAAREITPVPQWDVPDSRYMRGSQFGPAVLRDLLSRWQMGLLDRYLREAEPRRRAVHLIRELSYE